MVLGWIAVLVDFFSNASSYFYDLYLEAYDAPYIPYAFAWPLYLMSDLFADISWAFYDFYYWAYDVVDRLGDILSWSTIYGYITSYWPNLNSALSWFSNWYNNVINAVEDFFNDAQGTIQQWINSAVDLALAAWDWLIDGFNTLQIAWDNFKSKIPTIDELIDWFSNWWGNVLSTLRSWGMLAANEIRDLIDSKISEWFPFYDNLVSLWGEIQDFIADPLQYAYDKLDEWFERFW